MQMVNESASFINITASTLVRGNPANLLGIFVSSASSTPTIKVWDSTAASGTVCVDTFTPIAGSFYAMPASCASGIFVSLGGTVSATVFYFPVQ